MMWKPEDLDRLLKGPNRAAILAANPELAAGYPKTPTRGAQEAESASGAVTKKPKHGGKKRRQPNKLEASFARFLESRQARGEISPHTRWVYEGLMLRWGDGTEELRYSPDWVIYTDPIGSPLPNEHPPLVGITLIECKGGYCWKADKVRYAAARIAHPQFAFEFWEQVDNEWTQSR